jgi:hypothetical protein
MPEKSTESNFTGERKHKLQYKLPYISIFSISYDVHKKKFLEELIRLLSLDESLSEVHKPNLM